MAMARTWHGMEFKERVDRAAGRAVIGMGLLTAVETKRVTHVISGTLRRSVHAAPAGYEGGEEDAKRAANADLLDLTTEATEGPSGPLVEVGSWMPYACAEWVGRGHPGVTQGLENARTGFMAIVAQAFREEGL